ncbi:hypothetical protein [Halalkalibacter hemicellulosilyticus]|uniref:Uncharacterized protein n=1 Tax=Halalkalibacter hemicellulosilyticusJCM 9152 TaxID=1236971 RepID=W4QDW0_9BACI|nr:hypothetical protein [Halalkalibacter hemicellulosilyticus]GAE30137.1 hypothetical protein JCM9152_1534 [Halalkalibacter hemicellulosilyticusJCM 9152]
MFTEREVLAESFLPGDRFLPPLNYLGKHKICGVSNVGNATVIAQSHYEKRSGK